MDSEMEMQLQCQVPPRASSSVTAGKSGDIRGAPRSSESLAVSVVMIGA